MNDCMGRELEIGDLVTSMNRIDPSGILALFEVREIYRFNSVPGRPEAYGARLKIVSHTPRYTGDMFPDVHRTSDQISKIHDEDAMLYILAL